MNALYRRPGSSAWIPIIVLKWYAPFYFCLRWHDLLQDFEEVLVRPSHIKFEEEPEEPAPPPPKTFWQPSSPYSQP